MRKLFFLVLCFFSHLYGEVKVETFEGKEISSHLKEIRGLCDTIYCESPFLHNGQDHGYDSYLSAYVSIKDSIICVAYDDKKAVGIAAGMPMSEAKSVFKDPLDEHGHDLDAYFFLSEFGLRPEYQHKGIEEKLYSKIEGYAKEKKRYRTICFCEIEDFSSPTEKPPGTIVRDAFWKKSGFSCYSKLHFLLFWANINETVESPHLAVYWTKKL